MIVLSALFALDIAYNADMVMLAILEMVSGDFINTEFILGKIFEFRETKPFF